MQIAAEHGRPTGLEGQFPFDGRILFHLNCAIIFTVDNGSLDARQGATHRPGPDIHDVVVRNHDTAGLSLPPIIVDQKVEHLFAPDNGLGVQRLANTG